MNHDYFVELSQQRRSPNLSDVDDVTVRYHYHSATEGEHGDEAIKLRKQWTDRRLRDSDVDIPGLSLWSQIAVPTFDLDLFPPYTFSLQFPFRLTKAYLSKDERAFYIVDNPVRRDRVFQLPYVAPSSWKGSLRAALWKLGYEAADSDIRRLFGNEKGDDEDFRAGRLRCYPTYFKQHGLEIINPHDRERRVGIRPILFESVPAGTPGVFSLLYIPFDQAGQDDARTRRQVAQHLTLVANGVRAMFCTYGFGAKSSSGFGAAVENFVDKIDRRRENLPEGGVQLKAVLGKPEALREFEQQYWPLEETAPEEWQELLEGDEEATQAYQAARAAHESHSKNVQTRRVSQPIGSFDELVDALEDWAAALEEEVSND